MEHERSPWAALMHRWWVEYNPLYLFSAALVLGGLWLVSREVARVAELWAILGVGAISELYALALIGSAAVVMRMGHRRVAAMLGLLVVLFQADLTMHVETCAYLDGVGVAAAAVWLGLFVLKLRLLAWALQLRFAASVWVVALLGAVGLAVLPQVLRGMERELGSVIVTSWLFVLAAAAAWTERRVECAVEMDVRAHRCLRATWIIWGVLALAHAGYWSANHHLQLGVLVLAAPLVATRWMQRERSVWIAVVATLAYAAAFAPGSFALVAGMAASVLLLGARHPKHVLVRAVPQAACSEGAPYRALSLPGPSGVHDASLAACAAPIPAPGFERRLDPTAAARLRVGAAVTAYLGIWGADWWNGEMLRMLRMGWIFWGYGRDGDVHIIGAWLFHTRHSPVLVAVLTAALVAVAWRLRRPLLAAPVAPIALHLAWQRGWIPVPETRLAWGLTSTAAGFGALLVSTLITWRYGKRSDAAAAAPDHGGG